MIHTPEAYEAYAIAVEAFGDHIVITVPGGRDDFGSQPAVFERTKRDGGGWAFNIWENGEFNHDQIMSEDFLREKQGIKDFLNQTDPAALAVPASGPRSR